MVCELYQFFLIKVYKHLGGEKKRKMEIVSKGTIITPTANFNSNGSH